MPKHLCLDTYLVRSVAAAVDVNRYTDMCDLHLTVYNVLTLQRFDSIML